MRKQVTKRRNQGGRYQGSRRGSEASASARGVGRGSRSAREGLVFARVPAGAQRVSVTRLVEAAARRGHAAQAHARAHTRWRTRSRAWESLQGEAREHACECAGGLAGSGS